MVEDGEHNVKGVQHIAEHRSEETMPQKYVETEAILAIYIENIAIVLYGL